MNTELVKYLKVSGIKGGHVQGIAYDRKNECMYLSFTTVLIKTDMEGNILGSVTGIVGHLGCIAMGDDGRVYGSLEYKNDSIGKGVAGMMGVKDEIPDGFYIAIFDVDRIDRVGMDGYVDGVMTAVYLDEVTKDYVAPGHNYGCSGIDGVTFAPAVGRADGKRYLYVAYGIYSDTNRDDNDNQIILKYDIEGWDKLRLGLDQTNMHKSGPQKPDAKYFVMTGNTTYGVQNLEYDASSGTVLAAVYKGRKEKFPNYSMFFIDWTREPEGDKLFLADIGERDEATGIRGSCFPLGTTGMVSLGEGLFYVSSNFNNERGQGSVVELYKLDSVSGLMERV